MDNNINDNILKDKIEEYIKEKGWSGFFGLLATITPDKIDQKDLEKYREQLPINNKPSLVSNSMPLEINDRNPAREASIYAEEHIPAVQDDIREHGLDKNIVTEEERPRAKILEPTKTSAPNPWGDSKTVLPGELDLQ